MAVTIFTSLDVNPSFNIFAPNFSVMKLSVASLLSDLKKNVLKTGDPLKHTMGEDSLRASDTLVTIGIKLEGCETTTYLSKESFLIVSSKSESIFWSKGSSKYERLADPIAFFACSLKMLHLRLKYLFRRALLYKK